MRSFLWIPLIFLSLASAATILCPATCAKTITVTSSITILGPTQTSTVSFYITLPGPTQTDSTISTQTYDIFSTYYETFTRTSISTATFSKVPTVTVVTVTQLPPTTLVVTVTAPPSTITAPCPITVDPITETFTPPETI